MAATDASGRRTGDRRRAARAKTRRLSRTSLTRRGWTFLAAALGCAFLAYSGGLTELLYAAGLLAALPVIAIVLVRLRRLRLSVTRTFTPALVTAGATATVDLEVRNLAVTPSAAATWADRLPWYPGAAGPGSMPSLSPTIAGYENPRSFARLRYSIRPPERGVVPIGPLEIEFLDPFELAVCRATLAGTQSLYVAPAIVPLGVDGPSIIAGDGSARLVQRQTSGNDDDLRTREYRSGDALRRVHWRASARHGELMVRQEEQRTFPEARLLLDTRRDGYRDLWGEIGGTGGATGTSDSFEWAVRMIGSLGVHLHRSGFRVQFVETAPGQVAPFADGVHGGGDSLEFLASLAALSPVDRDAPRARDVDREEIATSPLFAVLGSPDADTLDWVIGQRRPREYAAAFLIGRHSDEALRRLAEAGWACVPVTERDDPARVWAELARPVAGPGAPAAPAPSGAARG